ncbi:MAG TPA: alpha/beta fold hydrolase [Ktedonobacterales bacterium]|nr:alpha/beta fold hydrolase [Ktedonobacterales bacterium]
MWQTPAVVLLLLLLLGFIALQAFCVWRARLLLRPIRKALVIRPADAGLEAEEARIPGPRGMLAAWYVPPRNGCVLICCHGINDNRSQWVPQIARLHERDGYGAVMFDFAGHGESEGNMVTYGVRERLDVAAVVEWLRSRGDVDMSRLGILGYSLGAITATLAAAELPELRCMVIESGFADLQTDIGALFHRFTGLPSFPFANLIVFWGQILSGVRLGDIRPARVIGQLSPRAVYIISDLCDEIANEPYDGEHLYASAREPKRLWQLPDIGHVRAFEFLPDVWIERVGTFLDEYLASAPMLQTMRAPDRQMASGE